MVVFESAREKRCYWSGPKKDYQFSGGGTPWPGRLRRPAVPPLRAEGAQRGTGPPILSEFIYIF